MERCPGEAAAVALGLALASMGDKGGPRRDSHPPARGDWIQGLEGGLFGLLLGRHRRHRRRLPKNPRRTGPGQLAWGGDGGGVFLVVAVAAPFICPGVPILIPTRPLQ